MLCRLLKIVDPIIIVNLDFQHLSRQNPEKELISYSRTYLIAVDRNNMLSRLLL